MYIGAHVPVTGGLFNAPRNGDAVGAEAIQIFTRNQMQWRGRPLEDAECGAFREAEGLAVTPLLEVAAGQGSSLGHRFEHLAEVFDRVRTPDRLGVCLDTCHLYAAGYDIATPGGYERTLSAFHRSVGLPKLKAVHLNDSKKGLGSRVDRHARAGEGALGLETFRRIVNDGRFRGIPLVVETPGPLAEWKKEIGRIRRLVAPRPARKRVTRR